MKTTLASALLCGALLASSAGHAENSSAIYVLAGLDGKILTNQDANNYFNLSAGQLGPQGLAGGVLHIGYQWPHLLSLEASANFGPGRANDVTYESSFGPTRHVVTQWATTTFSITPGLTWITPRSVSMLGLRLGLANLSGHVDDNAFGFTGSYDQEAQAFDVGLLLRSSQIVVGHLSLGVELGYDYTIFNNITNKNGKGVYNPAHSPERNVSGLGHNGDNTTLDFSGGHIALVLGIWSQSPQPEETPTPAPTPAP